MRGLECPFSGDIKVPETTISSCYELREIDRLYKTIRRLTSGLPVAPRKLLSPRSFAVSSLIIKERENATRRIRQSFKTSLGFSVRFNPSPTERCFICHQKKKNMHLDLVWHPNPLRDGLHTKISSIPTDNSLLAARMGPR